MMQHFSNIWSTNWSNIKLRHQLVLWNMWSTIWRINKLLIYKLVGEYLINHQHLPSYLINKANITNHQLFIKHLMNIQLLVKHLIKIWWFIKLFDQTFDKPKINHQSLIRRGAPFRFKTVIFFLQKVWRVETDNMKLLINNLMNIWKHHHMFDQTFA